MGLALKVGLARPCYDCPAMTIRIWDIGDFLVENRLWTIEELVEQTS
jgi:hypothetical protein